VLFGSLHAVYTVLDITKPRRLVPQDPAVAVAMANTAVRLARGGSTMWQAWVGFNFSHSLGVFLFGALCVGAGIAVGSIAIPAWALLALVLVGLTYLGLGMLYWFRVPIAGIAIGTGFLFVAWLMYVRLGV